MSKYRQNYDQPNGRQNNDQPRGNIRIDARTGEAKQFGIREAHRGGNGEIIGGVTADGKRFGTKDPSTNRVGFRIGNPSTPGLDLNRKMNPSPPQSDFAPGYAVRAMKAKQDARPTMAAAPNSQLLKDRQALYADMKGATNPTPQDIADRQARAKQLGITGSSFRRVGADLAKNATRPPAASNPLMAAAGANTPVQDGVSLPGSTQPSRPQINSLTPSQQPPATPGTNAAPTPLVATPEQAANSAKGTYLPGQAPPMKGATTPTATVKTGVIATKGQSRARRLMS